MGCVGCLDVPPSQPPPCLGVVAGVGFEAPRVLVGDLIVDVAAYLAALETRILGARLERVRLLTP